MADIANIPLDSIIIDDRSEEQLVQQAALKVYNTSNTLINDFSENSAITAINQGLAFAGAEILYKANQLPLVLIVDFLKVTGIQRSVGTKAVVNLTFSLTSPLNSTFYIPEGYEVLADSGNYSFFTDAVLAIPPGLSQGTVTATADFAGTDYNLSAYTINKLTQPLNYLAGVVNTEPASGGTAEETLEQAIERGLIQLRTKNLVSGDDYEFAAETILGEGSVCKAIGLLGANKTTKQPGAIHLFLLNANQEPANSAQLNQVKDSLNSRIQLGTSLYTSPMEILPVSAELTAYISSDQDPTEIADDLWEAYQEYLNPSTYPLGQDIILNEVEYAFRSTGLIDNIQQVVLNSNSLNIPLPNEYTLPSAYSINMQLVSPEGYNYQILRGAGENPDFGGAE